MMDLNHHEVVLEEDLMDQDLGVALMIIVEVLLVEGGLMDQDFLLTDLIHHKAPAVVAFPVNGSIVL